MMTIPARPPQRPRLTAAEYRQYRSEGYTDAEIRAEADIDPEESASPRPRPSAAEYRRYRNGEVQADVSSRQGQDPHERELLRSIAALKRAGANEQEIDAYVGEHDAWRAHEDSLLRKMRGWKKAGATDDEMAQLVGDYERENPPPPNPNEPPDEEAAYQRASRYRDNYGVIDKALNSATFGFGDEIRSTLGAAKDAVTGDGSFGPSYRGRMRAEAEGMARFAGQHPVQSAASGLAGALVAGGGIGGAAKGAAGVPAVGRAIAGGGAYGALAGAGNANGDASERARGAVAGGVTGAVAGGALQGGVETARTAARVLRAAPTFASRAARNDLLRATAWSALRMSPRPLVNAVVEQAAKAGVRGVANGGLAKKAGVASDLPARVAALLLGGLAGRESGGW